MAPATPAAKTERLLNLVMVLLYTRRPLTKQALRALIPQYGGIESNEAFDRMFERDKDDLRELGIPLVTEETDPLWDDEPGYRIDQRDYALPEIDFTPAELTVLGLASRAWAQASLAGPAAAALRKLRASGVERDDDSLVGIEPRLRTREPSFDAVRDAVMRKVPIRFDYAKPSGERRERRLQPWGLASWRGHWYVTGWDVDRAAERVFRLSRIVGAVQTDGAAGSFDVPAAHDAGASIRTGRADDQAGSGVAVLRVRRGRGHSLRQRATTTDEDPQWSTIEVPYRSVGDLVGEIAALGADIVAVQPHELVCRVVAELQAAAAAHGGSR